MFKQFTSFLNKFSLETSIIKIASKRV